LNGVVIINWYNNISCHARELAFQIHKEFERFAKYLGPIRAGVVFGGVSIKKDREMLQSFRPNVVVGTPGRVVALVREKALSLNNLKHFIVDECDKVLMQLGEYKED